MEPPDLNMNPDRNDAQIEAWLRQPDHALPDDGFSHRVLSALPPTRSARNWPRVGVCVCGALVGMVVAKRSAPAISWSETVASVQTAFEPLALLVTDPTRFAALSIAAVCVFYAVRTKSALRW